MWQDLEMGATRVCIKLFMCLTSSWNKHFTTLCDQLILWLSGSGNHPLFKYYEIASMDLGSPPNSGSVDNEETQPTIGTDKDAVTEDFNLVIMIIIALVLTLVIIAVIVCVVMIYRRGRIKVAGMSGCIQTDLYKCIS